MCNGKLVTMTKSEVGANTLANEFAKGNTRVVELVNRLGLVKLRDLEAEVVVHDDLDLDDDGAEALSLLLGVDIQAASTSDDDGEGEQ